MIRTTLLAVLIAALAQQQGKLVRPEQGNGVDAGKDAVDFTLKQLKKSKDDKDEKEIEVKLSSFKDQKPVALIFGSYT